MNQWHIEFNEEARHQGVLVTGSYSKGNLISARSGDYLAYQVGSVFHDAVTHVPVYYQPS